MQTSSQTRFYKCFQNVQKCKYLSDHWWQIPHITDNSPAGHDIESIGQDGILCAVPECISKAGVILEDKKSKQKGMICYLKFKITLSCSFFTVSHHSVC